MWVRIVTAVAALVSAAVHLILWFDGYRDIDVIGPAFLLNAVAGTVIAVLLLRWRHWVPAFLVTGFGEESIEAAGFLEIVGEGAEARGWGLPLAPANPWGMQARLNRAEDYLRSLLGTTSSPA